MPDQLQDIAHRLDPARRVRLAPFEVTHRVSSIGPQEFDIRGELDLATVPELRTKLSAAREGARAAVIDLRKCDFIDSAGLGLIVQAHRAAATNGDAPRVVVIARGRIARLFTLSQVDSEVTVVGSRPEAIRALCGAGRATRRAQAESEVTA